MCLCVCVKNKNPDGTLNLCGKNVARLRMAMEPKVSQNKLAGMLQLAGLDLEKNAVQRIESGERFVTDGSFLRHNHIYSIFKERNTAF